jgi:hypothetical protein
MGNSPPVRVSPWGENSPCQGLKTPSKPPVRGQKSPFSPYIEGFFAKKILSIGKLKKIHIKFSVHVAQTIHASLQNSKIKISIFRKRSLQVSKPKNANCRRKNAVYTGIADRAGRQRQTLTAKQTRG